MPQSAADREQGRASHPTLDDARRLVGWRPPLGVVSVYLRLDPGDRGRAWRTELRNGLAAILDATEGYDHDTRTALRATTERIGERFANHDRDLPRGEAGFVEVAEGEGEERWWTTHIAPDGAASACFASAPVVSPLLCLTGRSAPRGAAVLSAERVRLLEWAPGHLEELESWELSVFMRDWRERKAQRVPDPARAQAVSSSGRDQFDERLGESRERFLRECGGLAAAQGSDRAWSRLVLLGSAEHVRDFREGARSRLQLEVGGEADLISTPAAKLGERLAEATERLAAERERELAERALAEARGGTRGAAGAQEAFAALGEGRVGHLLLDGARAASACSVPVLAAERAESGAIGTESMVRRALDGGAEVTALCAEAAELLAEHEGVAALLRY